MPKRGSDLLGREAKFVRLFSLLKELSISIRGNKHYSFTKGCAEHKIRWNVNAISLRSVMIRAGFIEQSPLAGIYKFTELGEDINMSEMANLLIDKIDNKQEHLSAYVPYLDKSILQEPISEEEEADLENNISNFRNENMTKEIPSPFGGNIVEEPQP